MKSVLVPGMVALVTGGASGIGLAAAALDIIENRPPLSRWHPDYAKLFAAFLSKPK